MDPPSSERLQAFADERGRRGKGALSVFLFVTDYARRNGLPLDPTALVTEGRGQVKGLGRAAVQRVLQRHGIHAVLAKEGGRTSRKSLGHMFAYVALLNHLQARDRMALEDVEAFWIQRVHRFLEAKPFRVKLDASMSLRAVVAHLLEQAKRRQSQDPGRTDVGAVLQHLVGAKLECALGEGNVEHHSFSTADASTERLGDFEVGDAVVHVTAAPGEAVIRECQRNIEKGRHPILIVPGSRSSVAWGLADNACIMNRVDVFDIEQFIGLNVYEWGRFEAARRRTSLKKLLECYNRIVTDVETDPGLKISVD